MAYTDYIQPKPIQPFKTPSLGGNQVVTGNANSLRQRMQANPGRSYGQQTSDAANYLGSIPGRAGDAVYSGIDAVRDTFSQNPSGMRLNQSQQGADTKRDVGDFIGSGIDSLNRNVVQPLSNVRQNAINSLSNGIENAANYFDGDNQQATTQNKLPGLMPNALNPNSNTEPFSDNTTNQTTTNQASKIPAGFTSPNGGLPMRQMGESGTIEFTNQGGTGRGTMDFGSPEENARMAEKMRANRGAFSVLNKAENGKSLGDNFTASIRGNAAGQVYDAVQRGDISTAEGLALHQRAQQGADYQAPDTTMQDLMNVAMQVPNGSMTIPEAMATRNRARQAQRMLGIVSQQQNNAANLSQKNNQFAANQQLANERLGIDRERLNLDKKKTDKPQANKYSLGGTDESTLIPTSGPAAEKMAAKQAEDKRRFDMVNKILSNPDEYSKEEVGGAQMWMAQYKQRF